MKNKIPIYKSNKNYERILDLFLYENHFMNIKRIVLLFNPNLNNKKYFCRNCNNSFYSQLKNDDHISFCKTNRHMILLPSKNKYLQFKNLKNTIQHPFIAFGNIKSYMKYTGKNIFQHHHLMSGYYLHCLDEKYSKDVRLFNKLEDFRDSLIKDLEYIDDINENVFNHKIDMATFDQKEFDNVRICKHCNHNFEQSFNGRSTSLKKSR